MSPQPSYPKDAAVGGEAEGAGEKTAGEKTAGGKTGSEAASGPAGASDSPKRGKRLVAGAAIGIGSAAIVAALLYAKSRKSER